MIISGPPTGLESTHFDEIITMALKLSSRGGSNLSVPFVHHGTVSPRVVNEEM
jgi:hypothetical protein